MITFLLGLACGAAFGVILGALAAAVYENRMGDEVDRILKDRREYDAAVSPMVTARRKEMRQAAGVRVCSCVGHFSGPHFIDPDCPFHGGAA